MGVGVVGLPGTARAIGKLTVVSQDIYTAVTVSSGASSAYGSWVEVTAATAAEVLILGASVRSPSTPTPAHLRLRVGVGAAAAEVVAATAVTGMTGSTWAGQVDFYVPPRIAAGARVAVSVAETDAIAFSVTVVYATLANVEGS